MSIELKSTGFLIDELLTTELKMEHFGKDKVQDRYESLDLVITRRLARHNLGTITADILSHLVLDLKNTLKECWNAQETVMEYHYLDDSEDCRDYCKYMECALAAVSAQKLNAERNKLVRRIDELLGEGQYTQLEKSYAR